MSILTDTVISSTQTTYDNHELVLIFDENQTSYQLLAWHYCQISPEVDQQLIILIKETKNENGWLGTLITRITEEKFLTWKNHLNHRQYQLRLSEHENSIITHFEIQSSLILYSSSNYRTINNIFSSSSSQFQFINNHFITLKETTGLIFYLSDILSTNISNELLVFILDQSNHYELHHIFLNEKILFEDNEQISFEHCCCLNNENKPLKSKLISCSHFLSFINMSCEIEQDNQINKTNLHLIDLDNHCVHWTN
jgi:hypothetical protein